MLTPETLPAVQAALAEAGVDGWLLYDCRGINPISQALMRAEGLASRRMVAWIPRKGTPVAITHAIEPGSWAHWPAAWERRVYASWKSLEAEIAALVRGKTAAMEYSAGDAVPVVDRVPAGVVEMVRAAGAIAAVEAHFRRIGAPFGRLQFADLPEAEDFRPEAVRFLDVAHIEHQVIEADRGHRLARRDDVARLALAHLFLPRIPPDATIRCCAP